MKAKLAIICLSFTVFLGMGLYASEMAFREREAKNDKELAVSSQMQTEAENEELWRTVEGYEQTIEEYKSQLEEYESMIDEEIPLEPSTQIHVYKMCEKYGVDVEIFYSLMYQESRYAADSYNGSDYGICQINRVNWEWLEEDYNLDVFNERDNIEAGALMLSLYLDKANGDYAHALTGYNTGSVKYVNGYARKVMESGE